LHRRFGDGAELGIASNDDGRALLAAVVENAANADVVVGLMLQRADQLLRRLAAGFPSDTCRWRQDKRSRGISHRALLPNARGARRCFA